MTRQPIATLGDLAHAWASPEMERPTFWRTLIGRDNWAVLLLTKGKVGQAPPAPDRQPAPRLSPEWVRRSGGGLTAEQLLHERIGQHLRWRIQDGHEVDVAMAADIATTATIGVLAELGVDIAALKRPDGADRA